MKRETLNNAIRLSSSILQEALATDKSLHDAFSASVNSAIKDHTGKYDSELANAITDRIIGKK